MFFLQVCNKLSLYFEIFTLRVTFHLYNNTISHFLLRTHFFLTSSHFIQFCKLKQNYIGSSRAHYHLSLIFFIMNFLLIFLLIDFYIIYSRDLFEVFIDSLFNSFTTDRCEVSSLDVMIHRSRMASSRNWHSVVAIWNKTFKKSETTKKIVRTF